MHGLRRIRVARARVMDWNTGYNMNILSSWFNILLYVCKLEVAYVKFLFNFQQGGPIIMHKK